MKSTSHKIGHGNTASSRSARAFVGATVFCVAVSLAGPARADCDLDDIVGFTLIAKKTIDGWIQNGKRGDSFEGCEYDRIIAFTDGTGVACRTYSYSYSYRPTAYIFADGSSMKMCVGSSFYSVSRIR